MGKRVEKKAKRLENIRKEDEHQKVRMDENG